MATSPGEDLQVGMVTDRPPLTQLKLTVAVATPWENSVEELPWLVTIRQQTNEYWDTSRLAYTVLAVQKIV